MNEEMKIHNEIENKNGVTINTNININLSNSIALVGMIGGFILANRLVSHFLINRK